MMHRRPVYRLSRRTEWTNSAYRTPSLTALTVRRALQSSTARYESSGPSSGNNGDTSSPSEPVKPKFGNRWGSTQATKPAGLSAAEQAMRQSLIAKSQPPPPPQRSRGQSNRQWDSGPSDHQRKPYARRDAGPRENADGYSKWPRETARNKGRNWPVQEKNPFVAETNPFAAEDTQNRSPDRFQRRTQNRPQGRFPNDWQCPNCKGNVFASKTICPFCKSARSDSAPPKFQITRDHGDSFGPSRPQRSHPQSEDNAKFQQLGNSFLSEMEQDSQPETKQSSERDLEDSDPQESKLQTELEKEDFKKNQWSWDMSALEQLETLEAQEQQPTKPMKRRDGRKGRQSQSEDGDFDSEDRERLRGERRRQQKEKNEKRAAKKAAAEVAPAPLYLPEFISVSNLADVIGVRPAQFVQRMEEMGFEEITYRDVLDAETAGLVAAEFNFEAIFDSGEEDLQAAPEPEDKSDLPSRPPVVTIMGHVDHGKTTILDWLRKSSVAASEHGGITQHIGAFSVMMPSGKAITFLDTPGHSAFLEMRRRGADVTDIVVLVVASDDSVKPQTIEAIKHATQARVPVIVAISKIDKEGNNPDRVKGDLSVHGIHVEDYGGDVQAIGVSGKTGQGMVELEEAIVALSELLDHRADKTCNVEGWVIEASTKSYGRVASALIKRGTLRPGDIIVAGTAWARVRTLRNEAGVSISEATPGMPVEIDGWREQPNAGSELLQTETEQRAKDVVHYRLQKSDTKKMGVDMAAINEARRDLLEKRKRENEDEDTPREVESTGPKSVNFILKADVDGSAEAVLNSVAAVGNNEVFANIIRSGVGPVSEFDIEHAGSANGKIISFNQPIDPNIMRIAETEGVEIMDHNIIYKLIDEVKAILSEKLPPTVTTRVTGEAEIRQVFEITVKGREKMPIAGSRVRNGMINKTRKVRVLRGEQIVYDGVMVSLKNVKKDVTEMRKDTECGIGFDNWSAFEVGDHVQCYEEIFEKRYL